MERTLPRDFTNMLDQLAESYLAETDPIRASGFGGGAKRWRAEREPILDGVITDGDILDVGCANGYLLESLVRWGRKRGLRLTPHGVDRSTPLIDRARTRLPKFAGNMHVGDAWSWKPPQHYKYVYVLYDCVPFEYLDEFIRRLFDRAVADNGRLIVGAYGSRSRSDPPFNIGSFLSLHGWMISGQSSGGSPVTSLFAWTDKATVTG